MFLTFIITSIFAISMLTAAYKDALTMTIPNWASLMVLIGFFVTIPFVWPGWAEFGEHLAVGLSIFVLGFVVFALRGLGGGDAKLMAATSFWWTWPDLFLYLVYTTLAGGIFALGILLGRKMIPVALLPAPWMQRLFKEEKHMPYGLALAVGALVTLPQSEIFKNALGLS